ncbi:MAG TPA: hypothetical protein PL009_09295 [Flavipsychrobacter sp.]|nr:hypothetical protein [Flavipsychrobacter sp.]
MYFVRATMFSKTLILFCLCFFIFAQARAQQTLVGVRQGVGMWFTKNRIGQGSLKYAPGNHFTWNKEIFFRKNLTKDFTAEVSFGTYEMQYEKEVKNEVATTYSSHRSNFLETTILVQYDVTYPLISYFFPKLTGMKSFLGFSLIPRISFDRMATRTEFDSGPIVSDFYKGNDVALFVGMHYTHVIPISKRISISSALSFKMQPFDKYLRDEGNFHEPNRHISLMTGVLYQLR